MVKVIKSDGTKEAFDVNKVRRAVETAAEEARVPQARAREVAERAVRAARAATKDRNEVKSSTIRTSVLRELDSSERSIATAWRKYDSARKK